MWYAVQSCYYDDGHVIARIIDRVDGGAKPDDSFTNTKRCDIYIDWVDDLETANSMVESARSC